MVGDKELFAMEKNKTVQDFASIFDGKRKQIFKEDFLLSKYN